VARFEKREQSVAAFCREEGVSEASFYQWRKRLADTPAQGPSDPTDAAAGFKPVSVLAAASIAVRLPGGTRLRVPSSDPYALRLVLETLASFDAQRSGGGSC
jgi:hypothetical protein